MSDEKPKPFFRDDDQRRATYVSSGVAAVAVVISVFLSTITGSWMLSGTINGDHQELSNYVLPNLIAMTKQYSELEHRLTVAEQTGASVAATETALGNQIGDLHTSVNQLTLAVQKLTDLMPPQGPRR